MPQYSGVWSVQEAARLQSQQQWVKDPNFNQTTLLLQADNAANTAQNNTFLDSSPNSFPITRNGNTTQGTFTPFSSQPGAWANYFTGTAPTAIQSSAASTAFDLPGAFTVELWVYPTALLGDWVAVNTTNGFELGYSSSTTWGVAAYNVAWRLTSSILPTLNSWNHIVVARAGTGTNQTSFFLNGVRVINGTLSDSFTVNGLLNIGGAGSGSASTGYISNLRIVKGQDVYGYTNTSITVPNAPLTLTGYVGASQNITGTVSVLTCQSNRYIDNSGTVTLVPQSGSSVQSFSPFAPQYQYDPTVIGGSGYLDGANGTYLQMANGSAMRVGSNDFTVECTLFNLQASEVILSKSLITKSYLSTGNAVASLIICSGEKDCSILG